MKALTLSLLLLTTSSALVACEKHSEEDSEDDSEDAIYTCAMHPEIREHAPGDCPICGMDLVRVTETPEEDGDDSLVLGARALALAHVRTATVGARRMGDAARMFTGRIANDEGRERVLTSWVGGRVERLLVRTVGSEIRRGQSLARVFSPEVYAAAGELRAAIRQQGRLGTHDPTFARAAEQTVEAARQRLRLLGFRGAALTRLETSSPRTVTIHAPYGGTVVERLATEGAQVQPGSPLLRVVDLSSVWALLEVPEAYAAEVRQGQSARLFIEGREDIVEGSVDFVERTLRSRGRVDVRVVVPNEDGRLRPGMTLRGEILAGSGADGENEVVMIPASAPLFTGERSVVYVATQSEGERRFSLREVTLGDRIGDAIRGEFPVLSGLEAGEEIAVEGAFMIDAELSLRGGQGMMGERVASRDAIDDAALSETFADVLTASLDLGEALAADDESAVSAASTTFRAAVGAVRTGTQQGEDAWRRARRILDEAFAGGEGIAAWRGRMPSVESALSLLLREVPNETGGAIRRAHCPMADDGAGAHWLQRGEAIQNVYYGESMLRCGSVEATIPAGRRLE